MRKILFLSLLLTCSMMNPARSYGMEAQDDASSSNSSNSVGSLESHTNLAELDPNRTRLELESRGIVDITPLARLTHLQSLELFDNRIVDIRPLGGLTDLESLELSTNQIVDILPLGSLIELQTLHLNDNQIVDILPLGSLIELQTLHLNDNKIIDIGALERLTNLEELNLDQNKIIDIGALTSLTKLESLNLDDNDITDISPLAHLTNLHSLSLNENEITDISTLDSLRNLKELHLGVNQIVDIRPLARLTNLQSLTLVENEIKNIRPLARLTNLEELNLVENQITNINVLAHLTNLQLLNLNNNRIVNIRPLVNLANLQSLNLNNNRIVDISHLGSLRELKELHLSGNPIVDIAPLANLTKLQELYLDSNQMARNLNSRFILQTLQQRNPNLTIYFGDELINGQEAIMGEKKAHYSWLLDFILEDQFKRRFTDLKTVRAQVKNIQNLKKSASSLFQFMNQQKTTINSVSESLRTQAQTTTLFIMEQATNGLRLLTGETTDEEGVALPYHEISNYNHYINQTPAGFTTLPKIKELLYITLKTTQNKINRAMENDKKKIIDNAVIGCVSTVLREALENSHNKTGENLFGIYAKNMQEFITNPKGAKVIKTLTDAFWSDNDDVLDKALEKLSEDKSLPSPKAKYEQSLKKKIFTPIRETIRANMQHSKQAVKDQYYRPIIEGCFMTMRGHNTQFENPHEESSPACADGAYLHVLNALEGITTDFTFVGVPAQIQIADCDAGN